MELPISKNSTLQKNMILVLITIITFIMILTMAAPRYHSIRMRYIFSVTRPSDESGTLYRAPDKLIEIGDEDEKCDIFTGEWIPNPEAPYYTNSTCWAIHEHQNCMKYGRPDSEFMKWRWKPDGCELSVFNPYQFLEIVRGKSMAFVGDSVARNQMQSLICLLSKVEYPVASNTDDDYFRSWKYPSYNFTIAPFWSPYLIKVEHPNSNDAFPRLYLDEFDEKWTSQIDEFDYIIISAGHWFPHSTMYYENRRLVGCRFCQMENITDLPTTYGYRRAFRTAFRAITSSKNFKGVTFLRTYAPSHFENGEYNTGGNCLRKKPFRSEEIALEGRHFELYMTQMEEFRAVQRVGEKKGLRFELLDITQAMLLRPDGHPSTFGHLPLANVTLYNDCVHWCLPGPVDSWNDFLLHSLKIETRRSYEQNLERRRRRYIYRNH